LIKNLAGKRQPRHDSRLPGYDLSRRALIERDRRVGGDVASVAKILLKRSLYGLFDNGRSNYQIDFAACLME
jgi:hypothetical protein